MADVHVLASKRRRDIADRLSKGDPEADSLLGPRIVVCSSRPSSGKSTFCRVLANFAVRSGYQPTLVSADPTAPLFGLPGSLSATCMQHVSDVEEDFAFVPALNYWYGATQATSNAVLFQKSFSSLMDTAEERNTKFDRARLSGIIVDTPTTNPADPAAVDLLHYIIKQVGAEIVVIVGCEQLRHVLRQSFVKAAQELNREAAATATSVRLAPSGALLSLLCVPQPAGCIQRTVWDRHLAAKTIWRQYFYGTPTSPLRPSLIQIKVSQARIVHLTAVAHDALMGLLPLNAVDDATESDVVVVDVRLEDVDLRNRIIALSSAQPPPSGASSAAISFVGDVAIRDAPVACFMRFVGVTFEQGEYLVNAVAPRGNVGFLPGMALIVSPNDMLVQ